MVWYHDQAGDYPELSRSLKLLASSDQPMTEELCRGLFERFFGGAERTKWVDQACIRLEETLTRMTLAMTSVDGDVQCYDTALASAESGLSESAGAEAILAVVQEVLAKTRQMQESTATLRQALASARQETQLLRDDLAREQVRSATDELTGLANRRRFMEHLQGALTRLDPALPLCLLLIDIDHFKEFNDRHGHTVGDQVLKVVAKLLAQCVRGQDLVARYGGEEFAVLLPETRQEGALAVAENIRRRLAQSQIRVKGSGTEIGAITVSVGSADHRPGEASEQLIERADQALYDAKRSGRNRVCTAS